MRAAAQPLPEAWGAGSSSPGGHGGEGRTPCSEVLEKAGLLGDCRLHGQPCPCSWGKRCPLGSAGPGEQQTPWTRAHGCAAALGAASVRAPDLLPLGSRVERREPGAPPRRFLPFC